MPFIGTTPTQGFVSSFPKQSFTPNGSTTVFTLTNPVATANDLEVFVGNVRQEPTAAYTAAGTTLTMSEAPASGLNFYVINKSFAQVTTNTPDDSVSTAKIVNNAVTVGKLATSGTLPALNGSALTSVVPEGPAFQANLSGNQAISHNTVTVLAFATETYDTDSCYNNSNYRFTPNVAGYYDVTLQVRWMTPVSQQTAHNSEIRKNGAVWAAGQFDTSMDNNSDSSYFVKNALIPMNGTSDYLDFTCYQFCYTSNQTINVHSNSSFTFVTAHLALKL